MAHLLVTAIGMFRGVIAARVGAFASATKPLGIRVSGREILHLCLCYAFLELGLEKVTSNAFADNAASIRLHEKEGFERCALLRRPILYFR